MRTLSRPMFNMGGPIKQGIMQGIREPHQLGQIAGRIAPFASKVFGRVKGLFGKTGPVTRTVPRQGPTYYPPTGRTLSSKGYPGGPITGTPQGPGSAEVTEQIFKPKPWAGVIGRYFKSSPEATIAKKLYEGKGLITKPIKMGAKSPLLTAAGAYWVGDKWLWGDGKEVSDKDIAKITGHEPFDHTDKKKIKKAQDAFAEAQRDTRVKKYLDMMGYDRSKKTAVADALIDASKIVSDRGTLETKNITRDLINPIIQATSKRFDKPEQIREAVGLMSVKAAIQKDLEDPSVAKLRALQIESEQKKLRPGVGARIMAYMASKKDDVKGDELVDLVRLSTTDEGKKFKYITDEEVALIPELKGKTALEIVSSTAKEDGVYMVGNAVIEVEGGIPTQIK